MFTCKKCGNAYRMRTQFLLHVSVCCPIPSSSVGFSDQVESDSSEFVDDSDEDPDWQPEVTEDPVTPCSSPITPDQISVAKFAEENLINWPSDEQTPGARFAKDAQEPEHEPNECRDQEPAPSIPSPVEITEKTPSLSEGIKFKLHNLKIKIDEWQLKKRNALKEGKKSKARRINKQIGKLTEEINATPYEENVLEEVNEEEPMTFSSAYPKPREVEAPRLHEPDLRKELTPQQHEAVLRKEPTKRKQNYCIYCKRLVVKFAEHLEKSHPETPESIQLQEIKGGSASERRVSKTKITDPLRKLWNSIYNKTQPIDLIIPVKKRHGGKPIGTISCEHCKGHYRRDKLSIHLKHCASYLMSKTTDSDSPATVAAIKGNSLPHVHSNILSVVSDEFVSEILKGINVDLVTNEAMTDPVIMKFASEFHQSRREVSNKSYIIREIRDLTKLFLEMKKRNADITLLEDCFNPKYFDSMIESALFMAGYDQKSGSIQIPSIAYRLSQPIKAAADIVKNKRLASLYKDNNIDRTSIQMIDDFLNLINTEWKTKIGRICSKSQKVARVIRDDKVALQEDIVKFASYLEGSYRKLMTKLKSGTDKRSSYNLLMHSLVSHIMLLVRRRPVDFKSAKLLHYYNIDKHDDLISMANVKDFEPSDLNVCQKFHLFYVPGKNLQIVPMVLTPLMKAVMDTLIDERADVGITSDTLFALADNKNIKPNESLRAMAKLVSLKRPTHMTGNGLRHQAATFSRLHSTHPQYQDYLASVLGHNLFTHKKHYDLPMSIVQKMMVCPILHDIMTGENKNKTNHTDSTLTTNSLRASKSTRITKNLETTPLNNSNQRQCENLSTCIGTVNNNVTPQKVVPSNNESSSENEEMFSDILYKTEKEKKEKKRWTEEEQRLVFKHFGNNVLDKVIPHRKEVVQFCQRYKHILKDRSVSQVELFVRNHVLRKQLHVTPKVKRFLKLQS